MINVNAICTVEESTNDVQYNYIWSSAMVIEWLIWSTVLKLIMVTYVITVCIITYMVI